MKKSMKRNFKMVVLIEEWS